MDEISIRSHWVSAWSTSPIDASLSETGILDRLGVAVTDVSARTAVQLTARRHARAPDALECVRRAAAARGRLAPLPSARTMRAASTRPRCTP